jgi:tetrahydromethanopterin S-methyltransferase subunit B
MENVTHEQIYERLVSLESKVDTIDTNTKGMVEAFNNLQGAFKVLGWIANIAKPIIIVVGFFTALTAFIQFWKK